VAPGQAFWYANSLGLLEIAVNCGSAARLACQAGAAAPADPMDLILGSPVTVISR
jgi:hypothetical protein